MNTQGGSYLSRSWALLTRDKGWIKPVLLLGSALLLVPIVGWLGVVGYCVEWARLTAWGVDSAPKQRNIRIGECIASGWRAFLVTLGYGLVGALINLILGGLLGDNFVSELLRLALSYAIGAVGAVAALRATIYQNVGAGYQFQRLRDMLERDPGGLVYAALMQLILGVIGGIVIGFMLSIALAPLVMRLYTALAGYDLEAIIESGEMDLQTAHYITSVVLSSLRSIALPLAFVTYIGSIYSAFVSLMSYTAYGLWMRQFDVSHWGASEDPLPGTPLGLPAPDATYYTDYPQSQLPQPYQQQDPYAQQPYQPQLPYGQQPYQQQTPYPQATQDPYAQQAPYGQVPYGQLPAQGQGYPSAQPYDPMPAQAQPYGQQPYGQPQAYGQPQPYAPQQAFAPQQSAAPQVAEMPQAQVDTPEPTAEPQAVAEESTTEPTTEPQVDAAQSATESTSAPSAPYTRSTVHASVLAFDPLPVPKKPMGDAPTAETADSGVEDAVPDDQPMADQAASEQPTGDASSDTQE